MSLKDFKSDELDLPVQDDSSIPTSDYHREINTLRIEKLSNRVTIISVMIPVLIIAILAFAYIDMKERVLDVDETKKSQMDLVARQLEEKVNALDIRIAKNRFDLEQQLPKLSQNGQALENQMAKLQASKADAKKFASGMKEVRSSIAKISASIEKSESRLVKLDKQIKNNASQNKSALETVERINQQLQDAIEENNVNFKKAAAGIKEEIRLFKEEFDARLLELAAYDQEIAKVKKDISLLAKKTNAVESSMVSRQDLDLGLASLESELKKIIQAKEKKPAGASPQITPDKTKAKSSSIKPKLTIETTPSPGGISEQTLTE